MHLFSRNDQRDLLGQLILRAILAEGILAKDITYFQWFQVMLFHFIHLLTAVRVRRTGLVYNISECFST